MKLRVTLVVLALAMMSCGSLGWLTGEQPAQESAAPGTSQDVEPADTKDLSSEEPAEVAQAPADVVESREAADSQVDSAADEELWPLAVTLSSDDAAGPIVPPSAADEAVEPDPVPKPTEPEPGTVVIPPGLMSVSGLAEVLRQAAGDNDAVDVLARKVEFLDEFDRRGVLAVGDESSGMVLDAAEAVSKWASGEYDAGCTAIADIAGKMNAKAHLRIGALALVTRVTYFGVYDVFDRPITPGTKFLVYFELEDFGVRSADGVFESQIEVTVTIYDDEAKRIYRKEVPPDTHASSSRFRDFFFHIYVDLDKALVVPGEHTLKVKVIDKIKNMQAEKSIQFNVAKP